MPKVTWLGDEDENVKEVTWFGKTYKKGEAVEIDDPRVLKKASGHPQFEVEGYSPEDEEPKTEVFKPPSQTLTQGPVAKPGEPVKPLNSPPESSPAPKTKV